MADDPVTEPHAGALRLIGELRNRLGMMTAEWHPAIDRSMMAHLARYHLYTLEALVRLHSATVQPGSDR